tara:strand:- start:3141 stop:4910 length:1770 start_codon:yes stop_codon:yes gene_type:complete
LAAQEVFEPLLDVDPPSVVCGTPRVFDQQFGILPVNPVQDGQGLDFLQEPRVLHADYTGKITVRNLRIVGDYPTITFRRWTPVGEVNETWTRRSTQTIGGRLVSRFTRSWPAAALRKALRARTYGYDKPQIFWGVVETPVAEMDLYFRVTSKNIPVATVTKINNRVQYSSHVVNLSVGPFTNRRVTHGGSGFAFATAAKLFYQHFPDVYDGLSFVTQRDALSENYAAFHSLVKNAVSGIGLSLFNNTSTYGSAGRLQAIEFYRGAFALQNDVSNHEALHQWADFFDVAEMAGYDCGGHQCSSHMPLLFPRENYVGAVLEETRRVRRVGGDVYEIQRTPNPGIQHPLHKYAMGHANAGSVPNLVVFEDQEQFGDSSSSPDPGTELTGNSQIVAMSDILGTHGPRTGPVMARWRRALVVISPAGTLLSQKEMNYWNFYAKRMGENQNTTSYHGIPSFFRASGNKMRLRTDIDARNYPKITKGFQTVFRNYGRTDWRGVTFDAAVRSRYLVNANYTFSGRVTLTDQPYHVILIIAEMADGTQERFQGNIVGQRFSVTGKFLKRGNYRLRVFLFYPGSGSQYQSTGVSGVIVK